MMKYKWLLFDADNTLFDYDKAEAKALERTFHQTDVDYEASYAYLYRQINKKIWLELEQGRITKERLRLKRFELLFDSINKDVDPENFSTLYLRNLAGSSELMDGALETVRDLFRKARLVIVTNGLKEVQRSRFLRSEIREYFIDIIISEEIGVSKPDKRFFDIIFTRVGNPRKEEVLIIGDSLSLDIKGGNDYGIDTCWFNPKQLSNHLHEEATYEIRALNEIAGLLT